MERALPWLAERWDVGCWLLGWCRSMGLLVVGVGVVCMRRRHCFIWGWLLNWARHDDDDDDAETRQQSEVNQACLSAPMVRARQSHTRRCRGAALCVMGLLWVWGSK